MNEAMPLARSARPFLAQPVPKSLRTSFEKLDAALWIAVSSWMRNHGKVIKPKLSGEQERQLKMTFDLMDADGGGTIDGNELENALQLLGISMPLKDIEAVLLEVDRSGTGELEMDDFTQLMVLTLSRTAARAGEHGRQDKGQKGKQAIQQAALPFEVVALAYRRKKLIEALQAGDKAVLAKFAADQSYTSSLPPAIDQLNAPQNISSQAEPDSAGVGKPTTPTPHGSMRRRCLPGSQKTAGLRCKPGLTSPMPLAAATSEDILSQLHKDNLLPASEHRVVLALLKAGGSSK